MSIASIIISYSLRDGIFGLKGTSHSSFPAASNHLVCDILRQDIPIADIVVFDAFNCVFRVFHWKHFDPGAK